jgi:hypothetical protein
MAKILLVGLDPAEVDFSDPGLPPGLTADIIRGGIEQGLAELRAQGQRAESVFIPADPKGLGGLAERLAGDHPDCVVIGGGVRHPPQNLALFEALLNLLAGMPRSPVIALVDRPDQSAAAVARALASTGSGR